MVSLSLQRRGVVDEFRGGMTFQRGSLAYDARGRLKGVNQGRFETIGARRGVRIEESETNLLAGVTDFQTGWLGVSGATAIVTPGQTDPFGGTGAFRVVTNGGTNVAKWNSPNLGASVNGQPYTATVWVRVNSPNDVRVRNTAASPIAIQPTITQSQGWTPVTITVTGDGVSVPRIQFVTAFGMEAVSLDFTVMWPRLTTKSYATSFTPSTRSAESLTIPTAGILSPTQGTIGMWVYVDSVARRLGAFNVAWAVVSDTGSAGGWIFLDHQGDGPNWRLTISNGPSTKSSVASDTNTPDGWHHFTLKWTTSEAKVLIDGVARISIVDPPLPLAFATTAFLGRNATTTDRFLNALFADLHISSIARSDADILADYNRGYHVPDQYTTFHHLLDGPDSQRAARALVI